MEAVASLLENLLVDYAQDYDASAQNTTNTDTANPTELTGTSISLTVPSGGIVLLFGSLSVSHSAGNQYVHMKFKRDSTVLSSNCVAAPSRGDTNAGDVWLTDMLIDAPAAGTYTYKLGFATSANTAYAFYRRLIGLVLRVS
jgi:hypothetical protein